MRLDLRGVLADLARSRSALKTIKRQIRSLPSFRRVDRAWNNGDEGAGSATWFIDAAVIDAVERLDDMIDELRSDMRMTDAQAEALTRSKVSKVF